MKSLLKVKSSASMKRAKARLRAHKVFIYKFRKEDKSIEARMARCPRSTSRYMLTRVGLEAARLSIFNRDCVITQSEVLEALAKLKPRRNADPMAGA